MNIYIHPESKKPVDGYYLVNNDADQEYFLKIAEKYRLIISDLTIEPPYLLTITKTTNMSVNDKGRERKALIGLTVGEIELRASAFKAPLSNLEDDVIVKQNQKLAKKSAQVSFKAYGANGVAKCDAFITKDGRIFEIESGRSYLNLELREERYFARSERKELELKNTIRYIE